MTPPAPAAAPPLRSTHTASFPRLLADLGLSVLVTTYQAGKLVVLRAAGGALNTHFRDLPKPMGLAADAAREGDRLAVGTAAEVRLFDNVPAAAGRLDPPGRHDLVYLPRAAHVTGDVQIHELAWGGGDLWFVNTRFSCLCTLDGTHSFVPRWRPPFVSALTPDDRCHLNGLAMAGDRPGLVTALGATDAPGGWRPGKRAGGVLVDVASGETIAGGLSMPHSPRWHDGRVWLLESGTGTLGVVDLATGRYDPVAALPGFTRGLDFHGPLAFVGLSQVRESATFSGIPVADRPLAERACGVWVVDTRTGATVAFVRFEDAVQEVFAVLVLPGRRFPEVLTDPVGVAADSFVLPRNALGDVPPDLRGPG